MIRFTKIRWKNFLSTGGQFTEIEFTKHPSTLIVGENGAGKSTILDAICFALFNKPFRNINKPQLMNSINGKHLVVEVEFTIGKKDYKIIRGMKPGIFEIYCDDNLMNQDAAARDYQKYLEESILKLNYKSFTQIVILGSASFTPFMQLSLGHRREIIEDILDIQIFTVMNSLLKDKANDIKASITEIENSITLGKDRVKVQQQYVATLETDKQKKIDDTKSRIEEVKAEIAGLNATVEEEKNICDTLEQSINDADDKRTKRSELSSLLKKLGEKIKTQETSITFYEEHDVCPTCNQNMDDDLRTTAKETHKHKIDEIQTAIQTLTEKITEIDNRLTEISDIEDNITDHKNNVVQLQSKVIASHTYLQKLQNELDSNNTDTANIDEEKTKLKTLAKQVLSLAEDKSKITEQKHYLDIASVLLKDTGIKTKIIKQYLPVINKLVNKYLAAMDFFVHFELDESFNETIKSRHRDEFSYASFSEGEKQRIDLALLFTWRTIAKMKNSASTNLLLLDEVFDSSLDANGTDYVMNLLDTIGNDTNVFVISHKGDQLFDKFKSVIKFQKYQNYSRIST